MNKSEYIQEVRRMIWILRNADARYRKEANNAGKVYEIECANTDAELQTMSEKVESNLASARETLKKIPSNELQNDLEFNIHKDNIIKTIISTSITDSDSKKKLSQNTSIAIESAQYIDKKVKELHQLIKVQRMRIIWRNAFIIVLLILAVLLIFKEVEIIYKQRKLESNYRIAVAAFEEKNWEKMDYYLKQVFSIDSNHSESIALKLEGFYQQALIAFEAKKWHKTYNLLNTLLKLNKKLNNNENYKNSLFLIRECRYNLKSLLKSITVFGTMEFVWIPGGCFQMGSPDSEKGHKYYEGPVHEVCVDGFWMGKTEVTNRQFRKWKPEHNSKRFKDYTMNNDNQPAVFVSWFEAKAFAEWLTKNNNGYKFRLPTEAEWEYAARAGTTTSRFWGKEADDACQYANVNDKSAYRIWRGTNYHNCNDTYVLTAPAGSFLPNQFGLYDMLGNVWEWCEDIHYIYAYRIHSHNNPIFIKNGPKRVLRGGGWNCEPELVRCACRIGLEPIEKGKFSVGFRLVMEL